MKEKDLEEGTPDHPGETLETAEVNGDSSESAKTAQCGAGALARESRRRRKRHASGDA